MLRFLLPIALLLLFSAPAFAQRCRPSGQVWEDPWPASGVEVEDGAGGSPIRLTPAEGEALRCALVQALARAPLRELNAAQRQQVRGLGPVWKDTDGRPRIDTFFLSFEGGALMLEQTVAMGDRMRLSIHAEARRQGARWVIRNVGVVRAHARHRRR